MRISDADHERTGETGFFFVEVRERNLDMRPKKVDAELESSRRGTSAGWSGIGLGHFQAPRMSVDRGEAAGAVAVR